MRGISPGMWDPGNLSWGYNKFLVLRGFDKPVIWIMEPLMEEMVTYFGNYDLDLCFLSHALILQCSQVAAK